MLKYLYLIFALCFLSLPHTLNAQNDLLDELEDVANEASVYNTYEYPAFKAMKIANLQSTKVAAKGDWYMYVSHRFGSVKDGFDTFFGLDNANTKIQMVYGLLNGLQVGLSRESFRKTYAASAKLVIIRQTAKNPFNLSAYTTINYNSQVSQDIYPYLKDADRLSYATQLLIARRINRKISVEIAPSFVRQNLVYEKQQDHNQFALGLGGRYMLSKRVALNAEYIANFSRFKDSVYNNPLAIGLDIETGGHVFQLLFSNAQSTNEPGFISNAAGKWDDGQVYFGFNIVRVF